MFVWYFFKQFSLSAASISRSIAFTREYKCVSISQCMLYIALFCEWVEPGKETGFMLLTILPNRTFEVEYY